MIIDELLPALEELTRTPKCTWCLYPSPSCACGSIQAQAQCRVRGPPEDPPPPYQQEALTTIGSTPQLATGTLSSHAQAPGCAYFQQGITYPMPIVGAPEDPPPMWMPTAAEHGLRPTIEPCSQSTVTTTQRAVPRMPPPPGLTPPVTAIPALMSLMPTSGPTSSVTSTSTTRTRDTTVSTGPSASSSSQRKVWSKYMAKKEWQAAEERKRKRKRKPSATQTKEEAERAEGDDRDEDEDYVPSEEPSSEDPPYEPTKKELKRADKEGDQ